MSKNVALGNIMRSLKEILFLCIAFGGIVFHAEASSGLSFRKYLAEDGLSHNTVWCAIQDSYGFIWFGTSDGLNRFDGRQNVIFRNRQDDSLSIGNNYIKSLMESGDSIWTGTVSGIYIYDRVSDSFSFFDKSTLYGVQISSEVNVIKQGLDGKVRIGTKGQGLFVYDPLSGELSQSSIANAFIDDLCIMDDGSVYASSIHSGLVQYDPSGKFIRSYAVSGDSSGELLSPLKNQPRINCLSEKDGMIWFGSDNGLLGVFNPLSKEYVIYRTMPDKGKSIRCLVYDNDIFLIGTTDGIYSLDTDSGRCRREDSSSELRALEDKSVNSMMIDKEGTLWVMTNSGGVSYMTRQLRRFDYGYPDIGSETPYDYYSKSIGPISEDSFGNIWMGTKSGLCEYDPSSGNFRNHALGHHKVYDVRSILIDGDEIWVGTESEGLFLMNKETGSVRNYRHSRASSNTVCSNNVRSLFKNSDGKIYVGTDTGLCLYDEQNDCFSIIWYIGSMTSVTGVCSDDSGNIWVVTSNGGAYRYSICSDTWSHYEHTRGMRGSLNSNSLISLFKDRDGTIWIGTNGSGLCSYDKETDSFVDFDGNGDILPDKVIYAIEQDNSGNLWLSCNKGLFRVNPASKGERHLFTVNDGLQSNRFSPSSSLKSSDGILYFGSDNGFNSFNPDHFVTNTYVPPVYVTGISFPNISESVSTVKTYESDGPLYMSGKVRVPYRNNSFTIHFASLSYEDPMKNRYEYIFRGIDREWVKCQSGNTATYTNVPPGKYVFYVKGSNNDNIWNKKPASLIVEVVPPWWLTTAAKLTYFIAVVALLYFLAWRYKAYITAKYKRRMEYFRIAKEKEIYKSKTDFFINIAHEIRTPLTLIRLPLDAIKEKFPEAKNDKYISAIGRNVDYLLDMTNQLLDFQKMESGEMKAYMAPCNMSSIVSDVFRQFVDIADISGISCILDIPENEIWISADADKVRKILVNLMSNAVKFAKSEIGIIMRLSDGKVTVAVRDDGKGIPENEKSKIFDLFYQGRNDSNSVAGTGIGLSFASSLARIQSGMIDVKDNPEGGSTFILTLPAVVAESCEGNTCLDTGLRNDENGISSVIQEETSYKEHTLLIVEDNEELLRMVSGQMSERYGVITAKNGQEALEILEKDEIDIIVSDIMMPVIDGMELCRRVKTDIAYSHIPFIMLTAKTNLESKTEGMECGADAYMEKPFTMRQLCRQVENMLKLMDAFRRNVSGINSNDSQCKSISIIRKSEIDFISRVNSVMAENVSDENFSLDDMAGHLNMSRPSFYRKIKALSGMSPNEYVKNYRLERAASFIRDGMQIKEASERTGFTSSSYFAKCFKARFGVLPKDYADSLRTE